MTIVVQPEPKPPANRGGRPRGSRGNGKTAREKIARIENAKLVRQAEIEAQAQAARDKIAAEIELRREAAQVRKFDLYDAQEKARAPQFQIDQRGTLYVLGSLAIITFLTTAILTADGTIGAAESARFAFPAFGFILFGAFEVAILAFMLMYYVLGSRVDYDGNRVKSVQWFVAMIVASSLTVLLSAYHVLDLYGYDWLNVDMWFGIGIRLAVAVFFVLTSKGVANVLFAKAVNL
jgi:hypothetical protein